MTPEERFWSRVTIGTPDACWEWQGCRWEGYGRLTIHGKRKRSHRCAYELSRGPIPEGLGVRHTCDNPPCCNPEHLLLGTHLENMQDMEARGRRNVTRGERVNTAKISPRAVRVIRRVYAKRRYGTLKLLCARYGLTRQQIRRIGLGLCWRHVE